VSGAGHDLQAVSAGQSRGGRIRAGAEQRDPQLTAAEEGGQAVDAAERYPTDGDPHDRLLYGMRPAHGRPAEAVWIALSIAPPG
jgi:hypothetical protein